MSKGKPRTFNKTRVGRLQPNKRKICPNCGKKYKEVIWSFGEMSKRGVCPQCEDMGPMILWK